MNEVIDFLTKLGNVPIVNILFGAILVYLFTGKQKKIHDERVTKQILSFINMEIKESFTSRINSIYPYNELSLRGLELLNIQAGNIRINNDQLAKINKIYALFDEINKNILLIREGDHTAKGFSTSSPDRKIKELQKRCVTIAGEYVEETYSE